MKFLANMGISMLTVQWLRKLGHDALHLREQDLQRSPDDEILVKARDEGRTVLTMDLDFGQLLAASKEKLPSVIIFRLEDERSEIVNERLAEVLNQFQDAIESGAIVSVSDEAIRVRRLPIQ